MYNPRVRVFRSFALLIFVLLAGCAAPAQTSTPLPFNAPTLAASPTAAATTPPTQAPPSPTPSCENDLTFLADLTVPDGTTASAGQQLDKRWQVRNSGSCNWDEQYHVVRITGDEMGAEGPFALYPALAGTEAMIQIIFTAPDDAGIYRSAWQAEGPDGEPFGDPFFIEISVP